MSNMREWHRQYGDYFVVLKDQTIADWFVVITRPGMNNIETFQVASDLQDAQSGVTARMLREFHVSPTSDWKAAAEQR